MQIQQQFISFYILVYPPALSTSFGITPPRICRPLELTHPLSVSPWNYPTPYLSVSKIILLLICQRLEWPHPSSVGRSETWRQRNKRREASPLPQWSPAALKTRPHWTTSWWPGNWRRNWNFDSPRKRIEDWGAKSDALSVSGERDKEDRFGRFRREYRRKRQVYWVDM